MQLVRLCRRLALLTGLAATALGIVTPLAGKLESITIAGRRLADVQATFAPGEDDGALDDEAIQGTVGIPALQNWILVIDYGQRRAALLTRETPQQREPE